MVVHNLYLGFSRNARENIYGLPLKEFLSKVLNFKQRHREDLTMVVTPNEFKISLILLFCTVNLFGFGVSTLFSTKTDAFNGLHWNSMYNAISFSDKAAHVIFFGKAWRQLRGTLFFISSSSSIFFPHLDLGVWWSLSPLCHCFVFFNGEIAPWMVQLSFQGQTLFATYENVEQWTMCPLGKEWRKREDNGKKRPIRATWNIPMVPSAKWPTHSFVVNWLLLLVIMMVNGVLLGQRAFGVNQKPYSYSTHQWRGTRMISPSSGGGSCSKSGTEKMLLANAMMPSDILGTRKRETKTRKRPFFFPKWSIEAI